MVAGVKFIRVDNSARAMKSFDRGQIKTATEISVFEDNHVRNQKGSNVRDLLFQMQQIIILVKIYGQIYLC